MSGSYSNPYYSSPIDFRIPGSVPGTIDAPIKNALEDIYTSLNIVARTLVNYAGIGPQVYSTWINLNGSTRTLLSGNLNRFYCTAGEVIPYGAVVSAVNIAGAIQMFLADATDNTLPAIGFCNTLAGVNIGDVAEFILNAGVLVTSGLTPGAAYWLDTAAGNLTTVRPVAAGNIEQFVGIALSDTELNFNCAGYIQH